ncbi:MAG: filamentous hemagglutinin N-terminal domain-containing protein, partial [Nitrospina sp.]
MRQTTQPSFLKRLMVGFMIYLIGGFPSLVFALPSGGEIVSGVGTISQPTDQDMVIQQSTQKMIADWQAFGIGATESVQFIQPGTSSIALNRVIGGDPSVILGKLSANGQVFLTNASGVLFGPGAQVNVHGLVATTLAISNQDFLDGNYHFTQDPNQSLTAVVNQGNIEASGYVGLLAPSVVNSGTIVADLGSVAIGAGTEAVVDFTGDGLINFSILGAVEGDVVDTEGNVLEDRILNSGLIQANGGKVLLTAKNAGDVIRNVVNHSGTIIAHTVREQNGEIYLLAGDGDIDITGTLDASGDDAGEAGGTIIAEAGSVVVDGGSILATGNDALGGDISITGTDWVSLGGLVDASGESGGTITVNAGALSLADSVLATGTTGRGGSITLNTKNNSWEVSSAVVDASGAQGG